MEQAGKALSTWNRGLSGAIRNHLSSRVTDDLFNRIHAILGDRFFEAYKGSDPDTFRNEWAAALADFKPLELERGLTMLARQKFVPTLGEFSLWCRPALDPEYAFHEAHACLMQRDKGMRGDWSHPAVWRAASTLSMEVRQQDYAKCRTRWRIELERQLSYGWGETVPEPPLQLTHQAARVRPPNEAERRKIAELLNKKKESQ